MKRGTRSKGLFILTLFGAVLAIALIGVAILLFRYRLRDARLNVEIEDTTTNQTQELDLRVEPEVIGLETEVVQFRPIKTWDTGAITRAHQSFLKHQDVLPTVPQVKQYQLEYKVTPETGVPVTLRAQVFIPQSIDEQSPLYVFGSGTSGLADRCAPSLENVAKENIGNYTHHMVIQAAQDYVVIFPDYEGYHDPKKLQPYFEAESEAQTLLGAIISLYHLRDSEGDLEHIDLANTFVAGYSQGGHAALATASRWQVLPASIKLKGIIGFASASNVTALVSDSPWLAPYLIKSYESSSGEKLALDKVFQTQWVGDVATQSSQRCIGEVYRAWPHHGEAMFTSEFNGLLKQQRLSDEYPDFYRWLDRNSRLSDVPHVPVLMIQGAADPIVTAKTQRGNLETLCQLEVPVSYVEYPGVNHFQVRQKGFKDALQWMNQVMNGQPVTTSC